MNQRFLLLIFLCCLGAFTKAEAQGGAFTVTGIVKDNTGGALQDVTITEKGRPNTVVTDATGAFKISVARKNATLVVTSVGFETQELRATEGNLNVALAPTVKGLDEVTVVGYSTKRREQISSAVATVSGEKLRDVTSNNLANMLQGKAPGVVVSNNSGDPSAGSEVVVRGPGTINASTSPLYVVDGNIGGTYNPTDVESVTILKDAAATGLYGSRYGILTGRYCWRTKLKNGVLWGYSLPLIEPERPTVASFLKQNGYNTGCIGKWHLGLGWQTKTGKKGPWKNNGPKETEYTSGAIEKEYTGENLDFSKPFTGGPLTAGFDYCYGIPASLDMEPYIYFNNNKVTAVPADSIEEGSRDAEGYYRKGPIAPDFTFTDVLPQLTRKAVSYIEEQAKSTKPFFLYFPLPAPHEPWVPVKEVEGKSRAGRYGDFVYQVDLTVGEILKALDRLNISKNTIVIVTSDNGAYEEYQPASFNHDQNGKLRGQKADTWEGGHRIPFIARWPGKIQTGTVSKETICLTDLFATCANLVKKALPANAAEDSYSILPVLTGKKTTAPLREATVHHSMQGMFAIRQGDWKLILGEGGGGYGAPIHDDASVRQGQLYNLKNDPSESANLWGKRPDIVQKLSALLEKYKKEGRSRRI